jgi:hypothetical protein
MKLLFATLVLCLVGCATNRANQQAMLYDQLASIKVTGRDCPRMDYIVNNMETQLRLKGLTYANPEDLTDEDRKYNATARIVIWSLRIGCNNPDRYK